MGARMGSSIFVIWVLEEAEPQAVPPFSINLSLFIGFDNRFNQPVPDYILFIQLDMGDPK
jgi:hypothetical protein